MNKIPHWGKWIKIYKNALTKDECKTILNFCDSKFNYHPLLTNDKLGGRTSNQYFIDKKETIDNKINDFTAKVLKLPIENQEATSIVRYTEGQEYKAHFDFFQKDTKEHKNYMVIPNNSNRVMTALFYLNDGFEGGETVFPKVDVTIKPEVGMCITWVNVFDNGDLNKESLHAGLPVISGKKYIATKWVRKTPFNITSTSNKIESFESWKLKNKK